MVGAIHRERDVAVILLIALLACEDPDTCDTGCGTAAVADATWVSTLYGANAGDEVSLSDRGVLAVGAPAQSYSARGTGSVIVLDATRGIETLFEAYDASNTQVDDGLGAAIALAPSGALLAGAYYGGEQSTGGDTFWGEAVLYLDPTRDGLAFADWDLRIEGVSGGDNAGTAVGFVDGDGDGGEDVVVGAPEIGGLGIGSLSVFDEATRGEVTLDAATATFTEKAPFDGTGMAFTVVDWDADGTDDLALGRSAYSGTGSLSVFTGPFSGVLAPDAAVGDWTLADDSPFAELGDDLAPAQDTGDGRAGLFVAAPNGTQGCLGGALYSVAPGDPALAQRVCFPDKYSAPGRELELADLDGDGAEDLLVAVPGFGPDGQAPGQVLVWFGGLPTGLQAPDSAGLVLAGEAPSDSFGFGLSAADIDADGGAELAVGARYNDEGAEDAGKVYLFTAGALW